MNAGRRPREWELEKGEYKWDGAWWLDNERIEGDEEEKREEQRKDSEGGEGK